MEAAMTEAAASAAEAAMWVMDGAVVSWCWQLVMVVVAVLAAAAQLVHHSQSWARWWWWW